MGVFGDTLRQARAHKGVTLREAEVATRINRHWLLALEEEHFDQLPALIYQRGIVRNYATYLNLDPAKLLQMFSDARGDRPTDEPAVLAQPMTVAPAGSFRSELRGDRLRRRGDGRHVCLGVQRLLCRR